MMTISCFQRAVSFSKNLPSPPGLGAGADNQRYGLQRFYYDFTVRAAPGWRFVVLDGNDAGYGGVGKEQRAWFRAVLARAAASHERVICFCHYALLKEAARGHRMATPEPLLEALDRAGCVAAWFAGHDHAGGYAVRNGVHHVTLKGMVEAPALNAYGLIELHPDHLQEIGMGAEPTRRMDLGNGAPPADRAHLQVVAPLAAHRPCVGGGRRWEGDSAPPRPSFIHPRREAGGISNPCIKSQMQMHPADRAHLESRCERSA